MAGPKSRIKTGAKSALPLLLQDGEAPLTRAAVTALCAYIHPQTVDDLDGSAHDRLFGAVMARIDVLQAQRTNFLRLAARLQNQPQLWPLLLRNAGGAAAALLADTQLLADDRRRHAQVAGLLAVMAATLHIWRNDTSADLSATLRACDTALRRYGAAIVWLGLAG